MGDSTGFNWGLAALKPRCYRFHSLGSVPINPHSFWKIRCSEVYCITLSDYTHSAGVSTRSFDQKCLKHPGSSRAAWVLGKLENGNGKSLLKVNNSMPHPFSPHSAGVSTRSFDQKCLKHPTSSKGNHTLTHLIQACQLLPGRKLAKRLKESASDSGTVHVLTSMEKEPLHL